MERLQDHHIAHHRRQWESGTDTKWIRRSGGLIVALAVEPHKDLHDNCPGVPLLDIYMARRVKGVMMSHDTSDPLTAVDTFCFAVESAIADPRAHDAERLNGEGAILAIREQIPFIKAGAPQYV